MYKLSGKTFLGICSLAALTVCGAAAADMGRTTGTHGVSASGTAQYAIPIWIPPGPRGVQPSLAISYDSGAKNGPLGVGWSLQGFTAIERCRSTLEEDGGAQDVLMHMWDKFCLSGNKLRITSAPWSEYGTSGAEYQTQIANFSRITSVGTAPAGGPHSFVVHGKDGSIYEYGGTADSRIVHNGMVFRWMVSKVSDREGNSYVITYTTDDTVGREPATVSWGPTVAGGDSYQYKATFAYSLKTVVADFTSMSITTTVSRPNKLRLDSVTVGYSATGSNHAPQRHYLLGYELGATTNFSRLRQIKECGKTTEPSNCLRPTIVAYQNGLPVVSPLAVTVLGSQIPDLAVSFTDGYGFAASPAYVTTAQSNYTEGFDTALPLADEIHPRVVVGRMTISDGIGGTYDVDYFYKGARRHGGLDPNTLPSGQMDPDFNWGPAGESAGFEEIREVDSRDGLWKVTTFEQRFPVTGAIKEVSVRRGDQTTLISRNTITNTFVTLQSEDFNRRYFVHPSETITEQYEVDGPLDGQMIGRSVQTFIYDDPTHGNLSQQIVVTTDKDAASLPSRLNETSTTTITHEYDPPITSGSAWCTGFVKQMQIVNSSSVPGISAVTRTKSFEADASNPSKCRVKVATTEPGDDQLEVVETFFFDAFGNIDFASVEGRERTPAGIWATMPPRAARIHWGTTGQFAESVTDAVNGVKKYSYNYSTATVAKVFDPNSDPLTNVIEISYQYDDFGRLTRQTGPDGTYRTWSYADCVVSGCAGSKHAETVTETSYDKNGLVISDQSTYLDMQGRPIVNRSRLLTGNVWDGRYQWTEVEYDNQGRAAKQYMPCITASVTATCRIHAIINTYDIVDRLVQSSRPRSLADPTTQQTTYEYRARTRIRTDAQSKTDTEVRNVNGTVRRQTDANQYSLLFAYDAAGSLTGVTDSLNATLLSEVTMKYGILPFQVAKNERSLGLQTRRYNSLGELVAWTDAKNQQFSATYDAASRMLTRTEPDSTSAWQWGSSKSLFNVGRPVSMSSTAAGETYQESYTYDDRSRLLSRTISMPGGTYVFNNAYDPDKGWLDTLTYPVSTAGYRFKLKYGYSNGAVQKISDANAPSTVFWTGDASDAWGQISQETLGGQIVTTNVFDPVTSRLSFTQSGVAGNPTSLQSYSFLYDLVGNLTQRQNNKLGLTEDFYYGSETDQLYRLGHSTLSDGTTTVTNLALTYDLRGNIATKTTITPDPIPVQAMTWNSANYPVSITSNAEVATFAYGPTHQRWRMTFSSSGAPTEETLYIGGNSLLEKVVKAGSLEYRHGIVSPTGMVALYTRSSDGTNTLRYLLDDHQGSMETIADAAGHMIANASFTAFGDRRNATTWSGPPTNRSVLDAIVRQGFTFHTALGSMGLNHMNGRVQDAITGRFLSPDLIADCTSTQGMNRYSYVRNNPLSRVDPTGFVDTTIDHDDDLKMEELEVTARRGGGGGGAAGFGFFRIDVPMPDWRSLIEKFQAQLPPPVESAEELVTIFVVGIKRAFTDKAWQRKQRYIRQEREFLHNDCVEKCESLAGTIAKPIGAILEGAAKKGLPGALQGAVGSLIEYHTQDDEFGQAMAKAGAASWIAMGERSADKRSTSKSVGRAGAAKLAGSLTDSLVSLSGEALGLNEEASGVLGASAGDFVNDFSKAYGNKRGASKSLGAGLKGALKGAKGAGFGAAAALAVEKGGSWLCQKAEGCDELKP